MLCVSLFHCFQSGIRFFYVDRNWGLRSRLIAVRQFNPTPEMTKNNRLSSILATYLKTVLVVYDLDVSIIFSATNDAGGDVKRLLNMLLPRL